MPRKTNRPKRRRGQSRDVCFGRPADVRTPCGRMTSNVRTSAHWDEVTCADCHNS